jgi:type VI secretion system secreted protein Hcp
MAQTVHLKLKILGQDIQGESTISSLERANTIECTRWTWGCRSPREGASAQITGRRQHQPVTIQKRVDKASPILFKALCRNEKVDEATFMFFEPDRAGSGNETKYMTVQLTDAYISSVSVVSDDATRSQAEQPCAMEEVQFVFKNITMTYENGGVTDTDSWSGE